MTKIDTKKIEKTMIWEYACYLLERGIEYKGANTIGTKKEFIFEFNNEDEYLACRGLYFMDFNKVEVNLEKWLMAENQIRAEIHAKDLII